MLMNRKAWTRLLAPLCFAVIFVSAHAEDLKAADIVSRHLDSIAPAEVRAALKSRVVQGTLKFHILVGGGGDVSGTWGRVSEQSHSNFVMRFAAGGDWRGEQFVFDGERTEFATATSSHTVRYSHSLSVARISSSRKDCWAESCQPHGLCKILIELMPSFNRSVARRSMGEN